ncbi:MAG: hypothetical protein ACU85V_09805 [Gammaproteobacteria bacterium]
MAARLARRCGGIAGFRLAAPVDCNMLFPQLGEAAIAALQERFYFYTWDEAAGIARWITSYDTTEEDVDTLAAAVGEALAAAD